MKKKWFENISYVLAFFYLVISICISGKSFIQNFPNTDGLAAIGALMALFILLSNKSYYFRKGLNWILLNLKIADVRYSFEIIIKNFDDIKIENLIDKFEHCISNDKNYKTNSKNLHEKNADTFKANYNALNATINFKIRNYSTSESESSLKIQVEGISNYSKVERNIKFMINDFLRTDIFSTTELEKINFTIFQDCTEFSIIDIGIFDSIKTFSIVEKKIKLQTKNGIYIDLNSNGITLNTNEYGKFLQALEDYKTILIS